MSKRVLLTGGAGFIGHHVADYIFRNTDWEIIVLDRLDTSGNINRLTNLESWEANKHRLKYLFHDLKAPINDELSKQIGPVEYILHLAASTHVDRSMTDPMMFVEDNVIGTTNILLFAQQRQKEGTLEKVINFSTDEVFGPAPQGYNFKETDRFSPSNPYSGTKAAAVMIARSFLVSFKSNIITTYTVNNFGERQKPEKLIPKAIRSIIEGTPMPVFAELDNDGTLKGVGSRFWVHCYNTASALCFLLKNGVVGEEYNVTSFDERTNEDVVRQIGKILGKEPIIEYVDVHKSRPGHDRRYALDGSKLRDLGWQQEMTFEEALERTVKFTLANPDWQ